MVQRETDARPTQRELAGAARLNRRLIAAVTGAAAPKLAYFEGMDARFWTASAAPAALLASLLALTCAACGEAAPVTWVGAPKSNDVAFALVEGDGAAVAYVCGGPTSFSKYSRWFTGPLDEQGAFTAEADGWTLEGTIGASVSATLTGPDGSTLDLGATRAEASSATDGLYEVTDSGCRTGVIAWTDPVGQPALQGTWCDDEMNAQQVTPVYPIEHTDKGIHVTVDLSPFNLPKRDLYVEQVPTPVAVR